MPHHMTFASKVDVYKYVKQLNVYIIQRYLTNHCTTSEYQIYHYSSTILAHLCRLSYLENPSTEIYLW